jgi:chitodextrinase
LTLLAYAQSSTSAYLTVNAITGASSYQTYQNGSYLGDLTGLALTVGSLAANTVYTFQVKAVAIDGTVLAVSNAEKITY